MTSDYFLWAALWLLFSGFFSAFIIFFDRMRFAARRMGFVYIFFFFIAGIAMLAISLKLLR